MGVGVVRTAWAGTSGGPGITQLYVRNGSNFGPLTAAERQAAVNAVRAFWSALSGYLPDNIALTVSPVVDEYNVPSGDLEASGSAGTAPTSVIGTSAAAFSMASGVKVNLNTTTIRNGRRVRGGIYVVPAASTVYTADGAVGSAIRTAFNTAGAALLSALSTAGLQLVVYSRPLPAGVPNGPRTGDAAPVTNIETNEKGAVLRGRRD